MAMNNETAGERVFDNVDDALAERIVSRARENSRESERPDVAAGRIDTDKPRRRSVSIIKIALPAVLILIALWVLIRRR